MSQRCGYRDAGRRIFKASINFKDLRKMHSCTIILFFQIFNEELFLVLDESLSLICKNVFIKAVKER